MTRGSCEDATSLAKAAHSSQRWLAVLGRRDEPTDAIEDYCGFLARALAQRGCSLEVVRVRWAENGWRRALKDFSSKAASFHGQWALVQYTALSWSRRGFPLGFVRLVRLLKRWGMSVMVVFHDPHPFGGRRWRDRVRRRVQLTTMRRSARLADRIISTVSPDCVPWMRATPIRTKCSLAPVGSNVICPENREIVTRRDASGVVVFSVTKNQRSEAELIGYVVSRAAKEVGPLRLVVFGRGARQAETVLRESLEGSNVELAVFGVVSPEQGSSLLSGAALELFVRHSGLSSRRSSGIAAIACGLPIVGFAGEETAAPITEAGVLLVSEGDRDGVVQKLVSVLRDSTLRETLSERSRNAARQYFSWERIAECFLSATK